MPPKPIKPQLPSLDTGPLPLGVLRDQARRQLLEVVDSRRGKKALILDQAVSGPLSLLDVGLADLLTEHGVVKLLYLDDKRLDDPQYNAGEPKLADIRSIIYLVRATVENAQRVAAQIKNRPRSQAHDFSVCFVPRQTIACERVLEEEGVLGDVSIGEYALDMIAYDDDVISLELDSAFRDCIVDGDSTPLYYMAAAIMRLQGLFGLIPRVQGKGPAATAVRDMCIRMRRENPAALVGPSASSPSTTAASRIDHLVLLDREVDVVTPMMTQITFEGLVDEVTGIKHGSVPWQPKASDKPAADSGGEGYGRGPGGRTLLNSSDTFYREFRDLPYHVAIMRLQKYAQDARREYSELSSKDLAELKSFVKGLPKLNMLDRLSDVATPPAEHVKAPLFHDRLNQEQYIVEGVEPERSIAFVEELIYRGADLVDVLRLVVLLSAVGGGLPRRQLDALRQELLHTYGHQHILTLNSLEKSGLLKVSPGGKSQFSAVRKALQLIVPEDEAPPAGPGSGPGPSAAAPTDVSYLYKGYAPLSIRLVEAALRTGWGPISEPLMQLPGSHFDIVQTTDANGMPTEKHYKPPAAGSAVPGSAGTSAGGGGAGTAGGGPSSSGASPATGTAGGAAAGLSSSGAAASGAGPSVPAPPPRLGATSGTKTVLVAFIGGVTYSEISALRFLSSLPEWPYRFVVLTTKIVNGRTLLQSFVDPLVQQLGSCVGLQQQQ